METAIICRVKIPVLCSSVISGKTECISPGIITSFSRSPELRKRLEDFAFIGGFMNNIEVKIRKMFFIDGRVQFVPFYKKNSEEKY